jgi:SAM-dependent methyltransferase
VPIGSVDVAVVPARNEESTVADVVADLTNHGFDVIVVDDASTDSTGTRALGAGAKVVRRAQCSGVGGALRDGLTTALTRDPRSIVTVDADGQHAGGDARRLADELHRTAVDLVVGDRTGSRGPGAPSLTRRLALRGLSTGLRRFGVDVPDPTCGLRAMRPWVADLLAKGLPDEHISESVGAIVLAARAGALITAQSVTVAPRRGGVPSTPRWRMATTASVLILRLRFGGAAPGAREPVEPARSRLAHVFRRSRTTAAIAAPEIDLPSLRRPLPPLGGHAPDRLFELLSTVAIDGGPPEELRAYLSEDFERFVHTVALVGEQPGRVLEIGANPYFTTTLLRETTACELTMINSFDTIADPVANQRVSWIGLDGVPRDETFVYHNVNVETDLFPFPDESFDVVLFCEVIEHLLRDPVAALAEIRRVLAPDGTVVVTTPNVARLENVARLVAGANLYDPYSGYGPYGRHNREFTRHELVCLLRFCGFEPLDHFTVDVHDQRASLFHEVSPIAPLVVHRQDDLGQYLFSKSSKVDALHAGSRPTELFRSLSDVHLVSWDR